MTGVVKPGKNTLKVAVTDTWFNRLVYDAGQPEPARRTWTIAGPRKGSALRDSGLIGPVKIIVGKPQQRRIQNNEETDDHARRDDGAVRAGA